MPIFCSLTCELEYIVCGTAHSSSFVLILVQIVPLKTDAQGYTFDIDKVVTTGLNIKTNNFAFDRNVQFRSESTIPGGRVVGWTDKLGLEPAQPS